MRVYASRLASSWAKLVPLLLVSAPPDSAAIDRAEGLCRCGLADRAHHPYETEHLGLASDHRGESQTQKKIPETDAIFDRIAEVNATADADPHTLRISMDAKATVHSGPFARGGKRRVPTAAVDDDFQPEAKVTPVGILMPTTDELFVYGVTAKVTRDCLVDRIQELCYDACPVRACRPCRRPRTVTTARVTSVSGMAKKSIAALKSGSVLWPVTARIR